jgi:hypothetical protein
MTHPPGVSQETPMKICFTDILAKASIHSTVIDHVLFQESCSSADG